MKKKTHEQLVEEIFKLVGLEYEVVSQYINTKSKVQIRHNSENCNFNVYEVTPNNFLSGKRCAVCYGNKKKTHEQFLIEVYDLVKNEYSVLSEYISTESKVNFKHNLCDHTFRTTPQNFLNSGTRCPKCARTIKKTDEMFKSEVFNLVGDDYEFIGEYVNAKTKMKVKHKLCNYEYTVTPNTFLNGNRCPKCSGNIKSSHEDFVEKVNGLVGDEYVVIGKYNNAKTKITIKHEICDSIYDVSPNNFLKGKRCPNCNESHGELEIARFLKLNDLNFTRQYTNDNCKNIMPLRFDFAIWDSQNELICLIEFDGKQHFQPQAFFGGQEKFEYLKENDSIKNKYCSDNNINLIRIPYWDFERIEEILSKEFNKK